MRFQGGAVVTALVTEQLPEGSVPQAIPDEPLPIMVADLVAEMLEERAVGLRHVAAMTFPLGVVGLADVDGDQPQSMARNDPRTFPALRKRITSGSDRDESWFSRLQPNGFL
jgi:hypothetical protein